MNTSYPFAFAALKIRSMFSTVRFSVTLAPTAPQLAPFSLSTSFCGSMNTTAVSLLRMSMMFSSPPAEAWPSAPGDLAVEEVVDERRHDVELVFQREMSGVEQMQLGVGQIAKIGSGA